MKTLVEVPLFELPAPSGPAKPAKGSSGAYLENPMLYVHGPGPQGRICNSCAHLGLYEGNTSNYYKCSLRGITHGAGTDHRIRWPACAKYEAGE